MWAGKGEGAAEEEELSRRAQRKFSRDEGGDAEKGDRVSDQEVVGKRKSAQKRGSKGGMTSPSGGRRGTLQEGKFRNPQENEK